MVLLNSKPHNSKFHLAKFNYESVEAAILALSKLFTTDIYSSNQYWIEDESGKVLLSNRKTKKEAAKIYHQLNNANKHLRQ